MGAMKLMKIIVATTAQSGELCPEETTPFLEACQTILNCETPTQVALLSAFVDMFDEPSISAKDLASHFGVRRIDILSEIGELDFFIERGIITRSKSRYDNMLFHLSPRVIPALQENRLPEPKSYSNMQIDDFMNELDEVLGIAYEDINAMESCCETIEQMFKENQHLHMARRISSLRLEYKDLMAFSILLKSAVFDSEYYITQQDLKDYMTSSNVRSLMISLKNGYNPLVSNKIVEPVCASGQVEPRAWCFTNECLRDTLHELNLNVTKNDLFKGLIKHEGIEEKQLFFSDKVSKDYQRLGNLLQKDNMHDVLANLENHKMRKCFTCIFYGGPGTGKTESVRQLARMSERDIMLVDIPSIRSKWVGDTEKNIKAVFDRYRELSQGEDNAPILLFNEADAILGKRNDHSADSVDKMENAMQDIILQEMETLEGIMIATTNISSNLDKAFERRFLYKIQFEQPNSDARKLIWQSMLPELSEEEVFILSGQYELTGGEIENVVRKYIIDKIINCHSSNIDFLHELCQSEKSLYVKRNNVGFNV